MEIFLNKIAEKNPSSGPNSTKENIKLRTNCLKMKQNSFQIIIIVLVDSLNKLLNIKVEQEQKKNINISFETKKNPKMDSKT